MEQLTGGTEKGVSPIKNDGLGAVNIADEVLSLLAYKATIDVDGVASMAGGIINDLAGLIRKGGSPKGVRIARAEEQVVVEIAVEVEYGKDMTRVASDIQNSVAGVLKDMAGIEVAAVNVTVAAVHMEKSPEKQVREPSGPEG